MSFFVSFSSSSRMFRRSSLCCSPSDRLCSVGTLHEPRSFERIRLVLREAAEQTQLAIEAEAGRPAHRLAERRTPSGGLIVEVWNVGRGYQPADPLVAVPDVR